MGEIEAAGNGGARVGTEGGLQGVDVEADVDFFGEGGDDFLTDFVPGLALVETLMQGDVGELPYAAAAGGRVVLFVLAYVADAHLHELHHLLQLQGVIHDRGVRVRKTLVGPTQVGVRVEVQDAESLVHARKRLDKPVGAAVVASHHSHEAVLVQDALADVLQPGVGPLARLFQEPAVGLAPRLRVALGAPLRKGYQPFGHGPHPCREVGDRAGFLHRIGADAEFPRVGNLKVEEIQLHGSVENGLRPVGRAGAVGGGHVPRHGHQHKRTFLVRERKAEVMVVGRAGLVGVEGRHTYRQYFYRIFISVRRLRARFSSLSLGTAGRSMP